MVKVTKLCYVLTIFFAQIFCGDADNKAYLKKIFSPCRKGAPDFDDCLLSAFNQLNGLFKTGLPEYGVASFDPHLLKHIEASDNSSMNTYHVILSNVNEYNWTISYVTAVKTYPEEDILQYSQYFPYKFVDGFCDITVNVFGQFPIRTNAPCSLTFNGYRQTTNITRTAGPGSPLKVWIEHDGVDVVVFTIGNSEKTPIVNRVMELLGKPAFYFVRGIINELVSQAFTDVIDTNFRNFPFDNFIK